MARHPKVLVMEDERESAEGFTAFAGPASKRKKSGKITDSQFAKAVTEVNERKQSGDWKGLRSIHFVALYAIQHEIVYGVLPGDLDASKKVHACGAVVRLLNKEFRDDTTDMVIFMRWAWSREREREEWRRKKGTDGGRLTWQYQFHGGLVTEYRIHLARTAKRA